MRVQTQIQHHGYPMVSRLASKDIQVLVLGRDPDSTPLCCGCLGFAQSFAASRCQPGQPGQPKPTKPRPWRFGVSPRATSQEPARIKPCYEKIRENTRKYEKNIIGKIQRWKIKIRKSAYPKSSSNISNCCF